MSISNLGMKWKSFGKNIRIVAIFSIFVIIPYFAFVTNLISFIFICLAISDIKSIKRQLNEPNINSFSSKYLAAAIMKFIGLIFVNTAGVMIINRFILSYFPYYYMYFPFPFTIFGIFTPIILMVLIPGFIFMIIGCSIEKVGWENLKRYLDLNRDKFPAKIAIQVNEGANNLSKAALLWALGFLGIPIIIGYIMYIVGYFRLSAFDSVVPATFELKPTPSTVPKPSHIPAPEPTPPYVPEATSSMKYCPHCGAELDEGGKYCSTCGSALYDVTN